MVDDRRKRRARNQNITISARFGSNEYLVNGSRGIEYLVELDTPSCECPDWQKRQPSGGCKHILYVKMEMDTDSQAGLTNTVADTVRQRNSTPASDPYADGFSKQGSSSNPTPKDESEVNRATSTASTSHSSESSPDTDTKNSQQTGVEIASSTTDSKRNTREESESDEVDTSVFASGLIVAVLVTIPVEIVLVLLNMSPGTLWMRFVAILVVVEALSILDRSTDQTTTDDDSAVDKDSTTPPTQESDYAQQHPSQSSLYDR
ncbi:hypothetical protein [Haloarcula nitratireducens]|uniref:SWIM-type domain-containing protein n=1 Tax=Haloarcula nitratireducens TaxID=2487749 RepID=A0AAW4PC47_9EURY|nr:hypothetical protein [Halomicroarcula nitratireducens]MBX0295429.1 hypothetical protein [Halomicroarcula nitratireducens]